VVAGRDHREADDRAPKQGDHARERVAHGGGDGDPDRDREADVQARHRGQLVVERGRQV
jgi:hypothetical protein